jgi:hypothetical protein
VALNNGCEECGESKNVGEEYRMKIYDITDIYRRKHMDLI